MDFSLKTKMLKNILKIIRGQLYIEQWKKNINNTILLCGTGRSGTTWLSSIINYNNEFRDMFEPFYPSMVRQVRGLYYKQYIRPENDKYKQLYLANKILTGDIRSLWVDRFNRKVLPKKRLIKDIRVNLMLGWIRENYPHLPIVLIMRHPCAVAVSKVRLNWESNVTCYTNQDELVKDYLDDFLIKINRLKTDFEKHIAVWCIENYVPLRQLKKDDIYVVFYERLCVDPGGEVRKLFEYLDIPYENSVLREMSRPSHMSKAHSAIVNKQNILNNWKKYVSVDDINAAMELVKLFGLDDIYCEDVLPCTLAGGYYPL